MMAYNASTIDPMTKRGASQLLACTLTLALGALLMSLSGFAWIEIGGAKVAAAVVATHQMEDLDEPPTLPRPA
jgi:uncharacterized membrane protein YgaE (UPF0421/DUF939 family)